MEFNISFKLGGGKSKKKAYSMRDAFIRGVDYDRGYVSSVVNSPYNNHHGVYGCIRILTKNVSAAPFILVDANGNNVEKGTTYETFRDVNPYMSTFELFEAIIIYLCTRGEVMVFKDGSVGRNGEPSQLWVLDPKYFTPAFDKEKKNIIGWVYQVRDKKVPFEPEELIHFKFFNPENPFRGLSPIQAGKMSIKSDAAINQYNNAYFENGIFPGASFTTEEILGKEEYKRLYASLVERHGSLDKARRPLLLEGGLKYAKQDISQKDMEFIEQRKMSIYDLGFVFGIPETMLPYAKQANYKHEEDRRRLWEDTLLPLLRMLQDKFDTDYFDFYSLPVRGRFDLTQVPVLKEDLTDKAKTAKLLHSMGFTAEGINRRLELGFNEEDMPASDVGYIPANVIAIGDGEGAVERGVETLRGIIKDHNSLREVIMEKRWKDILAPLRPIEGELKEKAKLEFYKMRQETLANLMDFTKGYAAKEIIPSEVETVLAALLFDLDIARNGIAAVVMSSVSIAIDRGANAWRNETGARSTLEIAAREDVRRYLLDKDTMVKEIANTVHVDLQRKMTRTLMETIDAALDEGTALSVAEAVEAAMPTIIGDAKSAFNNASNRARTIARTEIMQAGNFGRVQAMLDEGVEKFMWLSARGGDVRDSHARVDGQIRTIGEKFSNGLRWPLDYENGDAEDVCNCRCTTLSVEE